MKKKILIFIITYYASNKLKQVFKSLRKKFLKNDNIKILISDDNSKDDTFRYAKEIKRKNKKIFIKKNEKRLNYGGNIKSCLDFAHKINCNYAIMLHGDGQYDPKYIPALIKKITNDKSIAVHGSRMKIKKNAIKGKMPIYKFIGNIILTFLFNKIYSTRFSDCHSGYWIYDLKYINKKFYKNLTNSINFDNQLRIEMVKKGLSIGEIAIKTIYSDEKKSFQLFYAIKFFFEIFTKRITN